MGWQTEVLAIASDMEAVADNVSPRDGKKHPAPYMREQASKLRALLAEQSASDYERLTIPPDTKLLSIERLPNDRWAIWIHTNEDGLKRPHWERDGTFLLLGSDGSIDRTTVYRGSVADLIEVMPKRGRK